MDFGPRPRVRKQLRGARAPRGARLPGVIDLAEEAFVYYTSEDEAHPIENALDSAGGPGGSRWLAAEVDEPQVVELEFDQPQDVSRLILEAEERDAERTQEVRVETSTDRGETYSLALVQEFNFSPNGATFEREDWRLQVPKLTNLRLTIIPNKRGHGRATLTTLEVYR